MESVIRVFSPPDKSYFLFGPRGSGKSTWFSQFYSNAVIIDLLDPAEYRTYSAFPERLKDIVSAYSNPTIFVIDEVQKVPELLSVVHLLIEQKKGHLFVLTGSSSRKLKRSGVDLLAGRAQWRQMHPFIAAELQEKFSLDKALEYGLLPLIWDSSDAARDLQTYIFLYMKEEVQMEGLVRNIDSFHRFLETISFSQASSLNYTNIAIDCAVSSKTVENYVHILQDLLLCFLLFPFIKRAKRQTVARPKFYFFDAGVYRAIRPKGPLDKPEEISGHALETLVAQHLRAWLAYSAKTGELFFWRTPSGLEVDFVVYGDIGFYAIEVKHSAQIKLQDLKGLNEFKKDYPESVCLLLYRGKEKQMRGHILCYPLDLFLSEITPNKELPV